MKVIVLKVKGKGNLEELNEVIETGHTFNRGLGGWQMPKDARPGDLAVWYAASPDQDYRAYGWFQESRANPRVKRSSTTAPWPVSGRSFPCLAAR
jgi:hypothetical protein